MPDCPILLLYVGEDFLFPTVFDSRGVACNLNEETSRHFWLYFNTATKIPDYSYEYRNAALNRTPGFYGHFLEECARGSKVIIDGADCDYSDLLERSGMTGHLRDLFVRYSRDDRPVIDTAFVFAESISDGQRKALMDALSRSGFNPYAFSVLLSEVIMRHVMRIDVRLKPSLGDQTLILNSVADQLVVTDAVYDGEKWMSDGTCQIIQDFGEAPIKDALVRYVIRTIDKSKKFLFNEGLLKEEFEFQRPNADKWLDLCRTGDNSIFISDFQYKSYGGPFSCSVPDNVLKYETDQALRSSSLQITNYVRNRIGDDLTNVVLLGVAFDDGELAEKVVRSVGDYPYLVINTARMPDLCSRYMTDFGSVTNDFRQFDKEITAVQKQRKSVTAWSNLAGDIRKLRIFIKEAADQLDAKVQEEKAVYDQVTKLCEGELKTSAFEKAKEKLKRAGLPKPLTLNAIQKAKAYVSDVQSKGTVFQSVLGVPGAKAAVNEIEGEANRILDLIRNADALLECLQEWENKIDFFESHYDEYLRLKNQFNDPYISHQQRIDIRNKMKEITMAPLPDLVLQHVKVRLEAEVKTVKKGLFCKKKMLRVAFSVLDGEALPCNAVLNIIRGKLPVEPQRESASCIRVDVGKGERSFEREFDLLEDKQNPGGKVFVCLFTEEHQIDADAILDEDGTDKPCRMISNV